MNQEEESIRKMFQQLKAENERNAPSFVRDWNAARLRMNTPRRRWVVWQISAAAAAILILLGTGWWMLFRQSTMQLAPVEIARSESPDPDISPTVYSSPVPETSPASRLRSRVKTAPNITRRHQFAQSKPSAILISQWRSPTESLLRTPGEQLFKRVPRLDESVVNIKATISN